MIRMRTSITPKHTGSSSNFQTSSYVQTHANPSSGHTGDLFCTAEHTPDPVIYLNTHQTFSFYIQTCTKLSYTIKYTTDPVLQLNTQWNFFHSQKHMRPSCTLKIDILFMHTSSTNLKQIKILLAPPTAGHTLGIYSHLNLQQTLKQLKTHQSMFYTQIYTDPYLQAKHTFKCSSLLKHTLSTLTMLLC